MQITTIPGGYRIDGEGVCVIQDFDPAKPFIDGKGQPFDSEDAARAHAECIKTELTSAQPTA